MNRGNKLQEIVAQPLAATIGSTIFGWLVVWAAVYLGTGQLVSLNLLSHGDGGHYLSIATTGYEFFPCLDTYQPGSWCGNTAWQPLYPAAIRLVSLSGLDPRISALIVTAVAGIIFTLLMLRDSQRSGASAWRLALLIAVAPGMVWMHAAFPMTMLLLWSALAFRAAARGAAWQAAVWSALAILTHSSGFFITLSVAIVLVLSVRRWFRSTVTFTGIVLGAVLLWLAGLQLAVGSWQAWWLVQAKYYAGAGGIVDRLKALIGHLLAVFFPAVYRVSFGRACSPGLLW